MRLLVPIDGSKASENALEYAVKLQQQLLSDGNKEIIILNVIPHFHVPLGFERPMKSLKSGEIVSLSNYIKEMNEAIKLEWLEKLANIKTKYETTDIKIRTEIIEGSSSIAESIINLADKENVNFIVVGNIGLGGTYEEKTLGSIARRVSEKAKCPVLIVQENSLSIHFKDFRRPRDN